MEANELSLTGSGADTQLIGGEIGFVDVLFLRIGYFDYEDGSDYSESYGAGLAWRFGTVRVAADFAYRPIKDNLSYGDTSKSAFGLAAEWPY